METWHVVTGLVVAVAGVAAAVHAADSEGITWLIQYDGRNLPSEPAWAAVGKVNATVEGSALHIVDDSDQECGFRAGWKADPSSEIVVEARVKVGAITAFRGGQSVWPWRDGAPVGLLVSDGRHQEGLCLTPKGIQTFTDRFHAMVTTRAFHTYRLVICGNDMSVEVDGTRRIRGADAFRKPADSPDPFIQFGSNAKSFTGDSDWEYVRLGVRQPTSKAEPARLKVTLSEPWEIKRTDKVPQTRPYLYNMGQGLLLMSVAQGPDAYYEPYGVLKSTDEGKTWMPIKGLDHIEHAPLPMIRLRDGAILGVSRWNRLQGDVLVGHTVHFDSQAGQFTLFENRIQPPTRSAFIEGKGIMAFDRPIFEEDDGTVRAVVYGRDSAGRFARILETQDRGKTWSPLSAIAKNGEAAVARLSKTEMTAILRQGTMMPLIQTWSQDGGKTWAEPVVIEEGSVDPDMELMSNGVLACSYGRPASCIMFSLDQGKTWTSHRVVTDKAGYNYTAIREIRPGRLLYVHDAPSLRALYIDVEPIAAP